MTSDKRKSKYHLLESIGYTNKLPMPIRATAHYAVNNEEQILRNSRQSRKLSEEREVLFATAIQFPCQAKGSFELIVDDAFLAQSRGIKIHDCHDFKVTFTNKHRTLHKAEKFFIEISHSSLFVIDNLDTEGGLNIVLITDSADFFIKKCTIKQAEGFAIIIHKSKQFQITQCFLENNLASGIMLIGDSKNGIINDCHCQGATGYFNHDAGIHLCATSKAISVKDIPEKCHEQLSIDEKTERPYGIVIENCVLSDNRAQGIYLEGAVNCLLQNNQINNNNKEGVCFDWGSCFNIFKNNQLSFNGERKNLSEAEVIADFIDNYSLLKDSSSSMKLPGISLDNGCMNLIANNKVTNNYGGGIKFIRTALLNEVDDNFIAFNTLGSNEHISFFHGISVNGLGAINNEFEKNKAVLLDFLPSQLNTFSNNIIRGHFLSVYKDKKSTYNTSINNDVYFFERCKETCFYILRQIKCLTLRLLLSKGDGKI